MCAAPSVFVHDLPWPRFRLVVLRISPIFHAVEVMAMSGGHRADLRRPQTAGATAERQMTACSSGTRELDDVTRVSDSSVSRGCRPHCGNLNRNGRTEGAERCVCVCVWSAVAFGHDGMLGGISNLPTGGLQGSLCDKRLGQSFVWARWTGLSGREKSTRRRTVAGPGKTHAPDGESAVAMACRAEGASRTGGTAAQMDTDQPRTCWGRKTCCHRVRTGGWRGRPLWAEERDVTYDVAGIGPPCAWEGARPGV